MRYLSWEEFNDCVAMIGQSCLEKEFTGVYGFPRGGLCLAVALSHLLKTPLLKEPQAGCLVVDDIYETGTTLRTVRELPGIFVFVWVSKVVPGWWHAIEVTDSQEWVVFPWEKISFAGSDEQSYKRSRGVPDEA